MIRKVFIMIATIVIIVVSPNISLADKNFSDLEKSNDHYDGIQWLVTKGITGYPNGTFGVETPLSREHAARIFSVALELEIQASSLVGSYFDDVSEDHVYADYIATVGKAGIFGGNNGRFLPNNNLKREQMATTLVNAFDLKGTGKEKVKLGNVDPDHRENVQILADLGLTTELDNFRPQETITRGQFASLLYRVHQLDSESPVDPNPEEKPNDSENKIVTTTYNYDFKTFVDKQMKAAGAPPQTDSAGSWYHASRELLEYYANPNNFARDTAGYYQFLLLSGTTPISVKDLNDKILPKQGALAGKADNFKEASKTHNVNEIYLIAHALLESGNGTSNLATGVEVGLNKAGDAVMVTDANKSSLKDIKKTYNFYGIGAVDRCPLKCGSERAYSEGWFTHKAAIIGGAKFINNGYISRGQDTLYKMRWNPATPATHQYATDVGWAVKQTSRIKKVYELYDNIGNAGMVFDVPVYQKQPAAKAQPTGAAVFHVNTEHKQVGKVGKTTASALNFRTGPTTNFSVIRQLPLHTEVTIIGENSGWYKVKVGKDEGWVSVSYVQFGETLLASFEEEVQSEQENEFTIPVQVDRVIGETVTDGIIMRSVPEDSEDNMMMKLPAGTKVEVLDEEEEWLKVRTDDETGWINSASIRIIDVTDK